MALTLNSIMRRHVVQLLDPNNHVNLAPPMVQLRNQIFEACHLWPMGLVCPSQQLRRVT